MENLKKQYDVIIIGSGLGGLTAGNRLAKAGYSVLILEQHFEAGGLAAYFNRKQHIFDVSLHGFPWGMVKTCRKYWSKEIADLIIQVKSVKFKNPMFDLETTYSQESFVNILTEHFKVPKNTVENFFVRSREMNFFDSQKQTTKELFEEFFPGRDDVIRLLMEPITYANGSTLDEPAITYGIVFSNFMNKGVYTFSGGTDNLIKLMKEELKKNDVDLITSAKVEKILVNNGKVTGVYALNREICGKSVLSNGNLIKTITDLTGLNNFSQTFRKKAEAVRINTSSCQVYIGIKEGVELPFMGDLIFTSTADKFDSNLMLSPNITSRTYSVYYPSIRPGTNKYSIVSSTNARYEDWEGLTKEQYNHKKDMMIEDTLNALSQYVPNIREIADYTEAATPVTFERYTGHLKGSSFGTKFEGLEVSMELPKEIDGLFHTGSVGIIMSGWLGAANYGVITSNEIDKYLLKYNKSN